MADKKTSPNHNLALTLEGHQKAASSMKFSPTAVVYGELSILGYNGYIPNVEKTGRRNRSKFLLCKRPQPNGIKKSRHYIVKQPQATKAIHDKDLHSISYTFSRSQTIIVEYRQDENTDMFQIGRSSEDPIDFVVMDTLFANAEVLANHQHSGSRHHHRSENNTNSQLVVSHDPLANIDRIQRHLAKVGDDIHNYASNDPRARFQYHRNHQAQAVLLNYPQPNISNLPPMMTEHFRNQEVQSYQGHHSHQHFLFHGHSSGAGHSNQVSSSRSNGNHTNNNDQHDRCANNRQSLVCKRSHATQSTISRFACRILVDRNPPYTARIYAAGFDSSKNIFLGEKATKWEQNNSIDGLTTNGVLLMHPKRGHFHGEQEEGDTPDQTMHDSSTRSNVISCDNKNEADSLACSNNEPTGSLREDISAVDSSINEDIHLETNDSEIQGKVVSLSTDQRGARNAKHGGHKTSSPLNDSNNSSDIANRIDVEDGWHETGGVWREVSVDGGIYAIRESRSAAQKGTRIESETNILQDGTLIDLCGATLLWRSLDGFKASPTRKSLEEKIDMLNASRPQCPVGLNTLVIPRKPILPSGSGHRHKEHHHSKDPEKNSHQPYVYLKCGHVQGYHDWGATEKSNQRTCPICLSVGAVTKLSMGLEPSFYVDSGPLTHVFNPCGHMASERTVRYWCSIKIPHGTHFFHSICPFCASPLATNEPASTRLIFQDDLD